MEEVAGSIPASGFVKVVFESDEPLRFAKREVVSRHVINGDNKEIVAQVGYFNSFEDIHHALESHNIHNEIWWDNGNRLFVDADAFITIP